MIFCLIGKLPCFPVWSEEDYFRFSSFSGILKFNVDEAAKGKPGLVGIGGVLWNFRGEVAMLPKFVGVNRF